MTLLAGVDDKVERQLLLAFERFQADLADERSIGIVALLVARQMVFALQRRITDVADESNLTVETETEHNNKIDTTS